MKPTDRALLQERVKTLVLRHALEASLSRLAAVTGYSSEDELIRLEHAIVSAARGLGAVPETMRLAALVAIEDAVGTIRGSFDTAHRRLDEPAAARRASTLAA